MRRTKWLRGCCVAGVAVAVLFALYIGRAAVWFHGSTSLGKEYVYRHTDGGVLIRCVPADVSTIDRIAKRDGREGKEFTGVPEAGPNVDGYRVYTRVIAGHVVPAGGAKRFDSFGDPVRWRGGSGRPGYFVIDTREHRLYDGLDKREWRKRLRRLGIKGEPRLYKPSMFDTVLGRNRAR